MGTKQEKNIKIINKANGKTYMVTDEELSAIQSSKFTKDLYTYENKAELPEMSEKISKASTAPESGDVPKVK